MNETNARVFCISDPGATASRDRGQAGMLRAGTGPVPASSDAECVCARRRASKVGSTMSRERFTVKLEEFLGSQGGKNSRVMTDEDHAAAVSFITSSATSRAEPQESKHRRWLRNLAVADYGEITKLVRKSSNLEVVKKSEIFDRINDIHIALGHAGRDKLVAEINKKYFNISYKVVNAYLATCTTCDEKRSRPRKGIVVKPILTDDINSRAQVDLISYESEKDESFAYIMSYQDHLTKFVSLRALKTKRAEEVAYHLIDIFCVFGAPAILQSDNGREFTSAVIEECVSMWPQLKIVHGKPRHSQSQVTHPFYL